MDILDEIVKELTKNCKTQEDFNEVFRALKKRGLEAALSGELTDHLGYDKHERAEIYSDAVSPTLISTVTNAVLDDVKAWQSRPLSDLYPIVYLDCLVVKVKHQNRVINNVVFLALRVDIDGLKELLGMWIAQNEGAKF